MTTPLSETSLTLALTNQSRIVEELKHQREDALVGRKKSRRRGFGIALLLFWLLVNSLVNISNGNRIKGQQHLLLDCTTPHHQCYEDSRRTTSDAVSKIITDIISKQEAEVKALLDHQDAAAIQNQQAIRQDLQDLLNAINRKQRILPQGKTPVAPPPSTTTSVSLRSVTPGSSGAPSVGAVNPPATSTTRVTSGSCRVQLFVCVIP